MNEVQIPEGSVFTYRLANGTHLLIHQSSLIQNKGTEEVDCEETVPLLFLEDGQIAYNGQIAGQEILETQLLDETSENTSFLLPASPLEDTDSKMEQTSDKAESDEAVVQQLVQSDPQQMIDSPVNEQETDNIEIEKVLEEETVTLDKLEDFVELVTSYKCRICPFTTPDQDELIRHFKLDHVQVKIDAVVNSQSQKETPVMTASAVTVPTDSVEFSGDPLLTPQPVSERLIYLCGQCNDGFMSLEACKQHMVQDHDMIVLDGAEDSKTTEDGSKDSNSESGQILSSKGDHLTEKAESENVSSNNKSSDGKQQSGTTVEKRKLRMPRILQRHGWYDDGEAQSDENKYKCTERLCQYKFNTEESLSVHLSCHTPANAKSEATTPAQRRDFACCICGERFERWRGCALHLWKIHGVDAGLLSCPVCLNYKTVTAVKLENHIKIHGDARAYTCPDCGKGFKQASQLRNHRVMHLDRKSGAVPRWYASKRCDICFKSYADSKCLKKHIQAVHSKLRPYVCQVCGHASARKAMLQMHLRQHTGEKPYGCTLCDYRTGDHNSLRRHTMRHTGQRPYRCPHCDYSAIQSNSYKNHLRSKHPGMQGLFSCTQCQFRTVSQEGFLQHVSDHKNGLISSTPNEGEIEVFPGNVAAAHLIYRCLNALSTDGNPLQANVTGSATSEDGTTQTITIQIPTHHQDGSNEAEGEDEETTPCYLAVQDDEEEEGVDTGGITIPAEPDPDPNPSPGIVPGGS